jgi:hypothetical protein
MNNLIKILIEAATKQIPKEYSTIISKELETISDSINTPYTIDPPYTIIDERGRGLQLIAENQTPQIRQFNEIINFASAY